MKVFGYDWEQIRQAQQGDSSALRRRPNGRTPEVTDADKKMLADLGEAEIRKRELFGVIDRLERAGLIQKT